MVVKSDSHYQPIKKEDGDDDDKLAKPKVTRVSDLLNIQNGTTTTADSGATRISLPPSSSSPSYGGTSSSSSSNLKEKVGGGGGVISSTTENGSCNGNEPGTGGGCISQNNNVRSGCPPPYPQDNKTADSGTKIVAARENNETILANGQSDKMAKNPSLVDHQTKLPRLENNLVVVIVPDHQQDKQDLGAVEPKDTEASGQDDQEEEEEVECTSSPKAPQAKEGGWGWFVVLGTFICYWLVPGMIRSYGAVYLEILETFPDATAAEAGWIPALLSSISIGLAPISAILGKFYTCRNVVFVGGLFVSVGLTLSSFANSVFYLYITFGLITGIGAGLITTPCVIVINSYFVKKRALASGMCLSGAAVGSFTIPIFVEYIVRQYRFRGTMLIMGAILLHICAAALLYTPDGKWTSSSSASKKKKKQCKRVPSAPKMVVLNGTVPPKVFNSGKKALSLSKMEHILEDPSQATSLLGGEKLRANSLVVDKLRTQSLLGDVALTGSKGVIGKDLLIIPPPLKGSQHLSLRSRSRASSMTPSWQHVKMLSSSLSHSVNDVTTSSVFYQEADEEDEEEDSGSSGSDTDGKKLSKPRVAKRWKLLKQIKKFIGQCLDFSLFKEATFLVTVVAGACVAGAFPHVYFFVPAFSQTMGYNKVDAAMLLSIASAVDLVSRISFGWFMDMGIIRRSYGLFISLAASTIGSFCIPLSNTFWMLSLFTAIYGFGSGTSLMLLPVLLADNHGVDRLPSSYGLMRLFQGGVTLLVPPLAGMLKDTTGIYNYCFVLMGCIVCIGAVAMLLMPCAERYDLKRAKMVKSPI